MKPRIDLDTPEPSISGSRPAESHPIESIYGVGKRYSDALRGIGVETVGDIARISEVDELEELLGMPAKVLGRIRLRALSYVSGEVLQAEPFEFPGDRLIYFDIETDPACSRVWLIGLLVDGWFTQLYAESWDQERQVLEKFMELLDTHRCYTLVSYSGTGFDYRVTLNALQRHGLDTSLLEGRRHIDLCTLLRRSFIFPHHSYALKELAAHLGYRFRQSELDGLRVALAYQRHIEYGTPLGGGVLEYNEDDVRSLKHLVDACFRLRNSSNVSHGGSLHYDPGWVFIETKLDPWLK